MKLRYYMRGLGIGILVTAILMGVTLDGKTEKLTDAEIIERAKELGMEEKYETTVLSETVSVNDAEKTGAEEKTPDSQGETVQETEPEREEAAQEEETDGMQEEMQEIVTDVPSETVQITVQGGDGSMIVSQKLKNAGVIEDVTAYDKFLCRNGYDKKICTGTHTIPLDASDDEIARIITTRTR